MEIDGIAYVVVSVKNFTHNEKNREWITLRRPKGKRFYYVVRYENGSLSRVL